MDTGMFIAAARQEAPRVTLQTLSGHEKLKSVLEGLLPDTELDRIFLLPSRCCISLNGISGSGKRTLAEAFAGSAVQLGCTWYRADICLLKEAEAEDRRLCIRSLLRQSLTEPCVFLLEPAGREDILQEIAAAYRMLPPQAAAVVILTEETPETITADLIPDLLQFKIELPDRKDREAFFENIRNRLPRKTNESGEKVPSYGMLAEESEGLTYRELTQVVQTIRLQLKARAQKQYGADAEALTGALKAGQFCYTWTQFTEVVRQARKIRQAAVPASQGMQTIQQDRFFVRNAGSEEAGPAADLSVRTGFMPDDFPGRRLTEDEAALNELFGALNIPDEPRCKQDSESKVSRKTEFYRSA